MIWTYFLPHIAFRFLTRRKDIIDYIKLFRDVEDILEEIDNKFYIAMNELVESGLERALAVGDLAALQFTINNVSGGYNYIGVMAMGIHYGEFDISKLDDILKFLTRKYYDETGELFHIEVDLEKSGWYEIGMSLLKNPLARVEVRQSYKFASSRIRNLSRYEVETLINEGVIDRYRDAEKLIFAGYGEFAETGNRLFSMIFNKDITPEYINYILDKFTFYNYKDLLSSLIKSDVNLNVIAPLARYLSQSYSKYPGLYLPNLEKYRRVLAENGIPIPDKFSQNQYPDWLSELIFTNI